MSLPALNEQRSKNIAEMRSLADTAAAEKRDLSENEAGRYDALEAETRNLDNQIQRAERLNAMERASVVADDPNGQPELRSYSISKALRQGFEGKLDGLEREWADHLAEQRGNNARGVLVPTEAILGSEVRANTTTSPAAGPGSNTIATDLMSMTGMRQPAMRVQQLGVTVIRNLVGNIELPRMVKGAEAHWIKEHENTTTSEAEFIKKAMSPKTTSAEYELSRKFLIQSNESMDRVLQQDLAVTLSKAMDLAAISGDGVDMPLGIVNDTSVKTIASAGNDIGEDTSLLMQSLEIDDVFDSAAFLTNGRVAHEARISRDTTGAPLPTNWFWHSRPFALSSQVKQTAADEFPIIYGAFENAILGYWSGIDILENRFDQRVSSKGGMMIHAFLDCDFLIRHEEAFSIMKRAI